MDDKYLRDIILNFMIAGKDTTGGTLSWFVYMLCKHPLVQGKIAQEVEETVGSCEKGQITRFVEKISEGALEKLHYLHAALSETLRLFPAVPVVSITVPLLRTCFIRPNVFLLRDILVTVVP